MHSSVFIASKSAARAKDSITLTCLRRRLHIYRRLHDNPQQTRPDDVNSSSSKPGHHPRSQHSHPRRRQVGRFSLPVFLFFAFTFAAITSSMDTAARHVPSSSSSKRSDSASTRHSPDHEFNTDDMDASPQSGFVDDDGNPLVNAQLDYGVDQEDSDMHSGKGGARDAEKERQQDTFGRHERHKRIPWTLREAAEAEKWQRDSRNAALRSEQGGRSVPHVRDQEHD